MRFEQLFHENNSVEKIDSWLELLSKFFIWQRYTKTMTMCLTSLKKICKMIF